MSAAGVRITGAKLLSARVTERTSWLFLRLDDEAGLTGWGECTLAGREGEVAAAAREALPGLLTRRFAPQGLIGELKTVDLPQAALSSAICQAVRDLAAQHEGAPLARALGASRRGAVSLYANINRRNRDRLPQTMAESARLAAAAGFSAVKIAPFDEVTPGVSMTAAQMAPGLERIAAVREAIGPGARLMIDCHWRFDPASAAEMIRAAAEFNPWWIECPLPETSETMKALKALRHLANSLGARLAGLEMCVRAEGFRPWIEAGAYDVMMPDVKYAGGPDEMLRIADEMAAGGVTFSPHNPSGPVSHLHSLHLCAACPGADLLEHQFDETPLFARLITPAAPESRNGAQPLPEGPGLGAGLDEAALPLDVLAAAGGGEI